MQVFKALGLPNHPWRLFWFLCSWCSPNLITPAKILPLKGRTYFLPHSAFSLSIHSAVRDSYNLQSICPNRSKNYKLQLLDSATLQLWRTAVPHFKHVQNWAITHGILWWKALKTWLFSFLLFPTTALVSCHCSPFYCTVCNSLQNSVCKKKGLTPGFLARRSSSDPPSWAPYRPLMSPLCCNEPTSHSAASHCYSLPPACACVLSLFESEPHPSGFKTDIKSEFACKGQQYHNSRYYL